MDRMDDGQNEKINKTPDRWLDICLQHRWTYGQTNGQMDKWKEWTGGKMDRWTEWKNR